MANERIIRKYANRRLYDASDSRHVTLDDIRKLVAAGERVKVIDDQSGEDLTRAMLLQIIANQEQFGTPVLSTQLLEAIVRFYGNPIQQMLASYLEQSASSLLRQQQHMQAEMSKVAPNTDGAAGRTDASKHGASGKDAGIDAVRFHTSGARRQCCQAEVQA